MFSPLESASRNLWISISLCTIMDIWISSFVLWAAPQGLTLDIWKKKFSRAWIDCSSVSDIHTIKSHKQHVSLFFIPYDSLILMFNTYQTQCFSRLLFIFVELFLFLLLLLLLLSSHVFRRVKDPLFFECFFFFIIIYLTRLSPQFWPL